MAQSQSPTQPMEGIPAQPERMPPDSKASHREKPRPKSRASTSSLQSVGVGSAFQPAQQHHPQQQPDDASAPLSQNGFFMQHGAHPAAGMYGPQEEMLMHYQHMHQQPIDPTTGMPHEVHTMPQQAFQDIQQYPMQYPHALPPYPLGHQHVHHMRQQSEQFEGSPAPEDSNNENGGAKRRKGAASSAANDQELRRLLIQYRGKTLKEVATEVQKNEGAGGKSEKAKQVFAMLWLQENCQRSSNSVRRDRVFTRYTERCGNERVPTLNPASFGKLVRIIFPNVQTRRLGVRGESKYHYVDLSLIMDDDDRPYAPSLERPGTSSGHQHERHGSNSDAGRGFKPNTSPPLDRPMSRATMETADFPAPSAAFLSKEPEAAGGTLASTDPPTERLDCKYINTPTIRFPVMSMSTNVVTALPSVRRHLPGTMASYQGLPTINSLSQQPSPQDTPIDLPDIHPYLKGEIYDTAIAQALYHLYRSYCIDVIDAFRKCKEKPFFNHHSAFNGKMTVPVSKVFSMPCLAPWIHECDMRMYKQIVRFIAPLAIQNVPDVVWNVFDRIGSKLVSHLITAFEEKCPVHVIVAKIVPAARFVHVLKKLKGANAATLQLSEMLEIPQQRTQMWLDLMSIVDPDQLLEDSMPAPENLERVQCSLKHDMRSLVDPVDDALVHAAEGDPTSAYAALLHDNLGAGCGILLPGISEESTPLLERWINWLERLPQLFEGHHPQCMVDWHTRYWRSIMTQMGRGGARSYQSWWFVESFTTQMLDWMTQMEGLLLDSQSQKSADKRESEKRNEALSHFQEPFRGLKRKRAQDDVEGDTSAFPEQNTHTSKKLVLTPQRSPTLLLPQGEAEASAQPIDDDATDADLDELRQGGPLDLPSFHTSLTSPVKGRGAGNHDDSGIDLGLDVDTEAEKEARKFNKRDWLLSSDPADGGIGLGVTA